MSTQKLERLLNLTAALLETRRPLTVGEIGQMIPGYPDDPASFRRTFERDKDDLREMGIPVDVVYPNGTDNGRAGYRIAPERYYLPDPGLDAGELAALRLAVGAIRVEGSSEGDAFRKLGGFPGGQPDDVGESALADVPTPPELVALFSAVIDRRDVGFEYHGAQRRVEPHRLDFQRGHWYLTAFDRDRGDRRSFRLDRIGGDIDLGVPGAFEAPEHSVGVRFEPWSYGDDPAVQVTVDLDASQAGISRSLFGSTVEWTTHSNGSATVAMQVTNRQAFRSFILGFLDHAVVVSPPEIRAEVMSWLEDMARGAA